MKKILFILTIAFFSANLAFSQTQDWIWSRRAGGKDNDAASSVATDANGSIYITGYYHGAYIVIGTDTLFNSGSSYGDMFLARYDDLGNVIWARSAGGTSDDAGNSVATDPDGNIFVGGSYYSPTMDFGSTVVITNLHTHSEVFIAKYDNTGKAQWARSGNCDGNDYQYSVATDIYGNSYLTGNYNGTYLAFGNDTIFNTGGSDAFLVKFDAIGNVLWAKNFFGSNPTNTSITARSVCTDDVGNIYLAGQFKDSLLTVGSATLVNTQNGKTDIFIIKYDNNGNLIWAKRAGGVNNDQLTCVAADNAGNFYITGLFSGTSVIFGSNTLSGTNAFSDIYVAKYDSSGNVLWAKSAGGTSNDFTSVVTTDKSGNAYVSGWFVSSSINFGSTTLTNHNTGNSDILVLKYSSNGTLLWAKNPGGNGSGADEWAYGIAASPSGSIYVTGIFTDSSYTFGATPSLINDSAGIQDIFLAKIDLITGINEKNRNEGRLTLYPNPTTHSLVIRHSEMKEPASINIYNVFGENVWSQQLQTSNLNNEHSIDLSGLTNGIYIVLLQAKDFIYRARLVKN